jgi:hypothetical protein
MKSSIFSRLRPGGTSLSALQAGKSLLYLLNISIEMLLEARDRALLKYESTRTQLSALLSHFWVGLAASPLFKFCLIPVCVQSHIL